MYFTLVIFCVIVKVVYTIHALSQTFFFRSLKYFFLTEKALDWNRQLKYLGIPVVKLPRGKPLEMLSSPSCSCWLLLFLMFPLSCFLVFLVRLFFIFNELQLWKKECEPLTKSSAWCCLTFDLTPPCIYRVPRGIVLQCTLQRWVVITNTFATHHFTLPLPQINNFTV